MAYLDPSEISTPALTSPQIRLLGDVNAAMVGTFLAQLRDAENGQEDITIEVTTLGGDAEFGRRLVLEVDLARQRLGRRLMFLGKTAVYSAGMTLMSAFPVADRFVTRDTELLIHCRQLSLNVQVSGPLRGSLPEIKALERQIESGVRLEEDGFRRLIEGSDVGIDELLEKAICNWYLTAEEALERRLVAGIL